MYSSEIMLISEDNKQRATEEGLQNRTTLLDTSVFLDTAVQLDCPGCNVSFSVYFISIETTTALRKTVDGTSQMSDAQSPSDIIKYEIERKKCTTK